MSSSLWEKSRKLMRRSIALGPRRPDEAVLNEIRASLGNEGPGARMQAAAARLLPQAAKPRSKQMSQETYGSISPDNEAKPSRDRRRYRRHDMENRQIPMDRWDTIGNRGTVMGRIADISAGGVRIHTNRADIEVGSQIRVRLALPAYAGISPFINARGNSIMPQDEWIGWMNVCRVTNLGSDGFEIGGQLLDMDEMDRGMLGLYLSTQPLAA
jgi:hypothetical protein